jgi:hypothetical protein
MKMAVPHFAELAAREAPLVILASISEDQHNMEDLGFGAGAARDRVTATECISFSIQT